MDTDKKLVYFDFKGKQYKEGDIVFNPFFGDFWLVEKYTDKEKLEYDTECDYCFSQYGSKDLYFMDLDEPSGFEIVCSVNDKDYEKYLNEFKTIVENITKEELNNE